MINIIRKLFLLHHATVAHKPIIRDALKPQSDHPFPILTQGGLVNKTSLRNHPVKILTGDPGNWATILFKGYEKLSGPALVDDGVTVRLYVDIHSILTVDMVGQTVTAFFWQSERWLDKGLLYEVKHDEHFKWNSSQNDLVFQQDLVWLPDIVIHDATVNYVHSPLLSIKDAEFAKKNGWNMEWWRKGTVQFGCKMDITNFPFDTQNCQLIYHSWTYPSKAMAIELQNPPFSVGKYINENLEYNITVSASEGVQKVDNFDSWTYVTYNFEIKRMGHFWVEHIVCPSLFVVVLSMVLSWIPPERTDLGAGRLSTAFVLLLITITFPASTLSSRPNVKYATWLDRFVQISTYLTFFPIIQSTFIIWAALKESYSSDGKVFSLGRRRVTTCDLDRFCTIVYAVLSIVAVNLLFGREGPKSADYFMHGTIMMFSVAVFYIVEISSIIFASLHFLGRYYYHKKWLRLVQLELDAPPLDKNGNHSVEYIASESEEEDGGRGCWYGFKVWFDKVIAFLSSIGNVQSYGAGLFLMQSPNQSERRSLARASRPSTISQFTMNVDEEAPRPDP